MKELILFIRQSNIDNILLTKGIPLSIALFITEFFIKLGSFSLEFFAFAAIFASLSAIGSFVIKK